MAEVRKCLLCGKKLNRYQQTFCSQKCKLRPGSAVMAREARRAEREAKAKPTVNSTGVLEMFPEAWADIWLQGWEAGWQLKLRPSREDLINLFLGKSSKGTHVVALGGPVGPLPPG